MGESPAASTITDLAERGLLTPQLFASPPADAKLPEPWPCLNWPESFVDKVICGDAIRVLRAMPDASVDACVVDPPYGLSNEGSLAGFKGGKPTTKDWKWDQYTDAEYDLFTHSYLREVARVLKKGRVAHIWCGDLYAGVLARIGKVYGLKPKCIIVARKLNAAPSWRMNNRRIVFETCLMMSNGPLTLKNFNFLGQKEMENFIEYTAEPVDGHDAEMVAEINFPMGRKVTGHDCEKPEAVILPLIESTTNPGDIVLDFFAGSGTTLVCAKKFGRHYIGVEREERFVRWIERRLDQQVLFTPGIMQADLPFDPRKIEFEDESDGDVGMGEVQAEDACDEPCSGAARSESDLAAGVAIPTPRRAGDQEEHADHRQAPGVNIFD